MASVSSAGLHLSQIDFNLHSVSGISIVFSAGQVLYFRGLLDGLTTDADILKSYVEYVLPKLFICVTGWRCRTVPYRAFFQDFGNWTW
jgi:hypothetical protein